MSLLHASMKNIRSKMKALEWSQHYSSIFKTLKGRLLRSRRGYLVEIQTHPSIRVLETCKNEEDPIINEGTRVFTTFLPL